VDADSGLVHTVRRTSGHVGDITEGNSLLYGEETDAFGETAQEKVKAALRSVKGSMDSSNLQLLLTMRNIATRHHAWV